MHIIISLDPGITTGICQFSIERGIASCFLTSVDRMNLENFMFLNAYTAKTIITERLPKELDRELSYVLQTIDVFAKEPVQTFQYSPGVWKPVVAAHPEWIIRNFRDAHEKDAFSIARYHLYFKYRMR